ncbi:pyridoxal-dependent decarboxylase, exosortase A system-associated [Permianibacter aggregans]|uniref:Diaminopimelate decarboxylase n=1 Tax=Permianibacter aggregans TaxID=1510150 RepID=A0A4R6UL27_9GAMM|nr:pyridoxal-dependent decarboxylase, exosortase A system-associated [Permianibacter aggregans]QGX39084.1 pyridoxal-dependent decarboxylase, exosortase A system-associated [Permianibacter aggregans]TDQ47708.1 diaminopimelate decarboxylase [Permianibacter aggregans]
MSTNPTASAPIHAENPYFPVVDNELTAGGIKLSELVKRAGQTPFYVYDKNAMTERVKALRAAMPKDLSLHYAMKANPMPAVVKHMSGLVDGIDVASGRELRVALDTPTKPHDISFAGPGKSLEEIRLAVASDIVINLESLTQLQQTETAAHALNKKAKVAIRVNPDFELKSSGMKMGGHAAQFGIDAEIVPDVLKRIGASDALEFVGFHIFWGSQNLRPENIIEAHDNTFALAYRLAQSAPAPVKLLNIGGGLGIPYFPGDKALELAEISANLERHLAECKQRLPEAEVVMELGRYLVGEAGLYVCEVLERKVSRGQVFLITNGGLHHHLAASGNFGQIIRKNYPLAVANRVSSDDMETVHVVGPLCTPLDLLGSKMTLPKADIGDLIAVYQSGAYGLTASPRAFLSHPDAVELLV